MAQDRRLLGKAIAGDTGPPLPHLEDCLHYIVDVALGVDPAGDGQAHQLHGSWRFLPALGITAAEHHGADLDRADSGLAIELHHQRLAGQLQRRDLGEKGGSIDVNGVAAGRLHDGNAAWAMWSPR